MTAYKVGDRVAIHTRHGVRAGSVRAVRSYRVRTKVTLADDSEWDTDGCPWAGPRPLTFIIPLDQLSDQARERIEAGEVRKP